MEPAWTQFESNYAKKVNIFMLNADDASPGDQADAFFKANPKLGQAVMQARQDCKGIPDTVWIDSQGNVLQRQRGQLSLEDLAKLTDKAVSASK